uniref:LPS-induced TNF-alpha factor n=1 Tax=Sinohyriopsis schlegelii TaxID=2706150 RepID=A0A0S1TPH1_SINSH|nr:LPS-induced TNF-alpha factor [Sinohyriopsis schlegelii]
MSGAPPPYPGGEKGQGAPAYGQPGVPAYGQPGAPAYGQPAYPQYGQPAQYNPPGVTLGANTTVVVAQPAVTLIQHFRESPVRMQCPHCRADIVTTTFYETGTLTWVACFVIAVVGFWLGCCLIPFCIDACKDCVHQCPNCRQQLGRYNRM